MSQSHLPPAQRRAKDPDGLPAATAGEGGGGLPPKGIRTEGEKKAQRDLLSTADTEPGRSYLMLKATLQEVLLAQFH